MEIKNYLGEIWRPVKDYEGLYEVSNYGRVRSLERDVYVKWYGGKSKHIKGGLLKLTENTQGYYVCGLAKYGKNTQYKVHQIVAKAFIPNPLNLKDINHRDENPLNNCVENLEWCTKAYNNAYGKRGKRAGKTNQKPILQYSLEGILLNRFESLGEAANYLKNNFNINSKSVMGCISSCANGYKYAHSAYGFIWKYE